MIRAADSTGKLLAFASGGVQTTISGQPATRASVMVMSAVETSGAVPPGM